MNGHDDDLDWAEALAGRQRTGAAAATQAEAALLRDAMKRWPAAAPAALQPASEEVLIGRVRAAGLLRARRWCAGCAERWRRWTGTPWRLGAAGLVLAAVLGAWIVVPGLIGPPPDDGAGVLRAPAGTVQLRQADDPAAARARLAARLAALRLPVQGYERFGRFGLDVQLPQPLPPAVAALLREEALAAGDDGSLRVEFEATQAAR